MVNVRVRKDNRQLFLDFRYRGVRCRELTALTDNPTNRKLVKSFASRIHKEIGRGTFDYATHFPESSRISQFQAVMEDAAPTILPTSNIAATLIEASTPTFAEFAEVWLAEMSPQWKPSHRTGVQDVLNKNLLPCFGTRPLHTITKADVLGFRAELAKQPGRKGATLGAARINKILCFLRQILNEAADRFEFTPAFRGIKPLKQKRAEVQPFTLAEVQKILEAVRPDFRDYLTVRFFTGLRSGEINGLVWSNVDLERNLLLIRETLLPTGSTGSLKTESSNRDIEMAPLVREAIERRLEARDGDSPWVFATMQGNPIDAHNFSNRVWYPLLRYLDLEPRRPYQTRHTAATLMLAAGENPEWIAKTLGHSTTTMLFKVYSRYVPNLTRQDGRAFAGLVHSRLAAGSTPVVDDSPSARDELLETLRGLPQSQLAGLFARALEPEG